MLPVSDSRKPRALIVRSWAVMKYEKSRLLVAKSRSRLGKRASPRFDVCLLPNVFWVSTRHHHKIAYTASMEEELRNLKLQLADEQLRREEEQRRRQQADARADAERNRREEEQRRREEAERVSASAVNQNLTDFLEGCHALSTLIKAVTEASSATGGNTTTPAHRLYPERMLLWDDFPMRQRDIWDQMAPRHSFWNLRVFPPSNVLAYVRTVIDPIGSEDDLRYIQRLTLENMVRSVFDEILKDDRLRQDLDLNGKISFENQASFQQAELRSLGHAIEGLSVSGSGDKDQKRRNTRADQFCVFRTVDGSARPVVAIEYKAPHKLTIREICIGLQSEI